MAVDKPQNKGPWDVVHYIFERFPTFALTIAVIGALFYGAGFLIQQADKSNQELADARQEIESERAEHRQELDALSSKANAEIAEKAKLAEAALKEAINAKAEADIAVASAKAGALAEVQETLLDASERIQALVIGQLNSMDELEKLRANTSAELTKQVEELTKKRDAVQAQLANAQNEAEAAQVRKLFARVVGASTELGNYRINTEATQLAQLTEIENPVQLKTLDELLANNDDPTIAAAVKHAMFMRTRQPKWEQLFLAAMGDVRMLSPDWLIDISCCDALPVSTWLQLNRSVLNQIDNTQVSREKTRVLIRMLGSNLPYKLSLDRADQNFEELFALTAKIVGILKEPQPGSTQVSKSDLFFALENLSLAAWHVWVHQVQSDRDLTEADKGWLLEKLKDRQSSLPILESEPTDDLVAFWTDPELPQRAGAYRTLGTADGYQRNN